ncbi:WXG100 family type VII secretion target [Rhizomonospora bruguierae]|uniref:WXG100 family type VII secretion target n=1 Tax=Rhizomonospora bruguierae TaxID=1581705 RepID=UPI001BCD8A62|nr:WXG100 family type VII secretion target [Micromonospora sp. NBRC 107566]
MADVNAVTPELLAAAGKAENGGQSIAQMLSALIQNLEPMQQGFVGQGGLRFQQVKESVNADLIAITDALNEVAQGIRTAGQDYSVADQESEQEVTKAAEDAGNIINRLRGGA